MYLSSNLVSSDCDCWHHINTLAQTKQNAANEYITIINPCNTKLQGYISSLGKYIDFHSQ